MNKRLYIGNLPYSLSEEELEAAFAEVGSVVSAAIIFDRETGRSKGFGFVEMDTEELAAKAIERWNGQELSGRSLTVAEARPRRERNSFGGGGGGYGGGGGGGYGRY